MVPLRCNLVVLVYIYCDCRDTVFQIEREEFNIPISIGRLLAAWLAAKVLVKQLECLLHRQKVVGSIPTLFIFFSL